VTRRKTNRRHMIGDHHRQSPGGQLCWSEPWMRFSARTMVGAVRVHPVPFGVNRHSLPGWPVAVGFWGRRCCSRRYSSIVERPLFRCSGCPAQAGCARVHGCVRALTTAVVAVTVAGRDTSGPPAESRLDAVQRRSPCRIRLCLVVAGAGAGSRSVGSRPQDARRPHHPRKRNTRFF
jgi:hypothetical protein